MPTKDDDSPFDIDQNRLDREWISQPGKARAAGVREADARHVHAQAKAKLDVVASRLALTIRKTPGAYELRDKPTADEVEAAVTLQPGFQAALKELNEAKYALDVASADTTAYVDRRKALEGLVELLGMDYQSEREPVARNRDKAPKRAPEEPIEFDPKQRD